MDKSSLYQISEKMMGWKWSFSAENCRKSKILWMNHHSKIFLQNKASIYRQICGHKVAKIQLLRTKIFYTKFSAKIRCWKWSFSTENGRKTKILKMKHPLKIFLQNIASRYRQISAHKVAKIQLVGTKIY